MDPSVLDRLITQLLEVRGRPGKPELLTEPVIRQLCVQSKQIFLQQPNLLELEAPIKICGIFFMKFYCFWIISLNSFFLFPSLHTTIKFH